MSGFLFLIGNVLLDIITLDATWQAWSEAQLATALDRWLEPETFQWLPLPYEAGWRAGQAFVRYRRAGGLRTSPLPDFYIGAHAEAAGLTLVTRDVARYATYFPAVTLITP